MKRNMDEIKRDLSHIFWIGGADTSGKSTVSDNLAEKYGFIVEEHFGLKNEIG